MKDTDTTTKQPEEERAAAQRRVSEAEQRAAWAAERLSQSPEVLKALLESASDGIVVVDSEGRLLLINAKVEEMFGYTNEELLAQPVEMLLPTRLRRVHTQHRQDYIVHPRARPMGRGFDLVGRRKDGSEFPVEISLSLMPAEGGDLIMGIIADISQRVQAEETLRQFAGEIHTRNKDLEAFAHTVAHDLKSPLARVIGFAELLAAAFETMSEEELRRHLQTIAQNARRVNRIIDELLLLGTVRDTEEVALSGLDMARLVDEAQRRLADLIEGHRAEIVTPPAEAWPAAQGYGPWIEEVWVNYLSNAILYGGQPPRVELGAIAEADGSIRFWVRDNGNGLTAEEQERLFTPFTRLEQARTKGHGLGLSIVRRIVEKLGGQVGVESQVGEGSVFSFTLPAWRTPHES